MSKGVKIELEEVEAVPHHRPLPEAPQSILGRRSRRKTNHQRRSRSKRSRTHWVNSTVRPASALSFVRGQRRVLQGLEQGVRQAIGRVAYRRPLSLFHRAVLGELPPRISLSPVEELHLKGYALIPSLVYPGYEIMKQVLSSTPFQTTLLTHIVDGTEGPGRRSRRGRVTLSDRNDQLHSGDPGHFPRHSSPRSIRVRQLALRRNRPHARIHSPRSDSNVLRPARSRDRRVHSLPPMP